MKSEDFDKEMVDPSTRRSGRNQQEILGFLKDNDEMAFTQSEIQKAIGAKHPSAVNYSLHSLQSRGEVEVKVVDGIQYWRYCHSEEEETGQTDEDGHGAKDSKKAP